jgi:hypothetical protein
MEDGEGLAPDLAAIEDAVHHFEQVATQLETLGFDTLVAYCAWDENARKGVQHYRDDLLHAISEYKRLNDMAKAKAAHQQEVRDFMKTHGRGPADPDFMINVRASIDDDGLIHFGPQPGADERDGFNASGSSELIDAFHAQQRAGRGLIPEQEDGDEEPPF